MRERLIEDWLAKVGERGFEVPFAQLLVNKGHRVLRMGHSPIEHGKDIITRDGKGYLHAYQLKQGSVGLKEWERIRPQIVALVESGIDHPNAANERFQPWLVISGEFSAPVLSRISADNLTWKRRGLRPLKVTSGKELLADFATLSTDFWPVELPEIKSFIALYQNSGTAFIDKSALSVFCINLLNGGGRVKAEVARRIAAWNIFGSYLLSSSYAAANHWAIVEGWTVISSHIAWGASRHRLPKKAWMPSFQLAQSAAMSALEKMKDESLAENALDPRNLEWDEITRVRSTYALGAVSAWFLARGSNADSADLVRAASFTRNLISGKRTLIWGESAMPFLVMAVLFLSNSTGDRLDEALLLSLIGVLSTANGRRSKNGLADPYVDADAELEGHLRSFQKSLPQSRKHIGRAYTLEGLVFLAARRLLRSQLESQWRAITYVDFVKFVPRRLEDLLLWRADDGSLDSRQPARPESWARLLTASRSKDYLNNLPVAVLQHPQFALLFALVFPQRLTTDLMLFLDDTFRLGRGAEATQP